MTDAQVFYTVLFSSALLLSISVGCLIVKAIEQWVWRRKIQRLANAMLEVSVAAGQWGGSPRQN